MSFAFPLGLFGLVSLPVILALHLFRERTERYNVSSLELWKFLRPEVRGKRLSRVRVSLLLLLDLLFATLITAALAQPQIKVTVPVENARHRILLLDTSLSMLATDIFPSRFVQAQQAAAQMLSTMPDSDVATVITFSDRQEILGDTRQLSRVELLSRLLSTQPGSLGSNVDVAYASALSIQDDIFPAEIHLFSDGAFPELPARSSDVSLVWHQFGSSDTNQAVLSIQRYPVAENRMYLLSTIANFSSSAVKRIATLVVDGEQLDSSMIQLEGREVKEKQWDLAGKPQVISVSLSGADSLEADDRAYLVVPARAHLRVVLFAYEKEPIAKALKAVPGIDVSHIVPDGYQPDLPFDIFIFRDFIPARWPSGNAIVLEPPLSSALLPTGERVDAVNMSYIHSSGLVQDIDFTGVNWGTYIRWDETPSFLSPLLSLGPDPILLTGKTGSTNLFILLSDLGAGSLPNHPAFPSLVARLLETGAPQYLPSNSMVGANLRFPQDNPYQSIRYEASGAGWREWRIGDAGNRISLSAPGMYTFELTDLKGQVDTHFLGVNAGDRFESDIRSRVQGADHVIGIAEEENHRTEERQLPIARHLIAISAGVLLLEAWIAWRSSS